MWVMLEYPGLREARECLPSAVGTVMIIVVEMSAASAYDWLLCFRCQTALPLITLSCLVEPTLVMATSVGQDFVDGILGMTGQFNVGHGAYT